jgi:hypothetical protein
MFRKINALLCSLLILYTSAGNLLAFDRHSCKREQQQDSRHCPMPMEKMDCCPMEQKENSCNCPEMNNNSSDPQETTPYVIINSANHPSEFIACHFILLGPDLSIQQEYSFSGNFNSHLTHNKIYKTIHSFLI